jgi:GNAT superfamily N-acetyltransferase
MKGSQPPLSVATLTAAHLPQALTLSEALNWPYRLEDWQFALQLGHGLAVEVQGSLCATALWWLYEDALASCGMIIVSSSLQHQGIGSLLMEELLRRTQGRTIILRSTREGRRLYERMGFSPYGEVYQHQGTLAAALPAKPAADIRPFRAADLSAICRLDRRASGMGRGRLLEALVARGSLVVMERSGVISGYACIRRWGRGMVIGPVVAGTTADAKALIATLLRSQAGHFVRIDVPETSGLSGWLVEWGLGCVGEVTSMLRGDPLRTAGDATLFALCSQSMG